MIPAITTEELDTITPVVEETHDAELARIRVPTAGGFIWLMQAGDPFPDSSGRMARAISMSNEESAAGYWPRTEALVLLRDVRLHWIMATLVP